MLSKLRFLFQEQQIRSRILFVIGILVLFRILSVIPIPGADLERLEYMLSQSQLSGFLNIFSAGGISTLSLVMLGVGPYITASIIMQLLTVMVPRIKSMYHEEGEIGRRTFTQYTRLLTVPLAIVQAFGFLTLLVRQGIVPNAGLSTMLLNIAVVTAGTMLLMWLGEMITERGIGNGITVIIFAGIVAQLPSHIDRIIFTAQVSDIPTLLAVGAGVIAVIAGVVFITEAERPIQITYAKQVRSIGGGQTGGGSTYMPLRLNQAGVIPIIFALSIFTFPQVLATAGASSANAIVAKMSALTEAFFQNHTLYAVTYFLLVFLFTYLYTAITFEPKQIADNLQKSGAFIPGIRPGEPTEDFISTVVTRITFVGAAFLGLMAVLPLVVQGITGRVEFAIGGTSLLIVVSAVLDIMKKLDAQVSMREY